MRATPFLATDDDWRDLDPGSARRLAAAINAARASGSLPGAPVLTGGQLLALATLREIARTALGGTRPPSATDRLTVALLGADAAPAALDALLEPDPVVPDLPPRLGAVVEAVPAVAPEGLVGRLHWIRTHWPEPLEPGLAERLILAADIVAEEARALHLGAGAVGAGAAPGAGPGGGAARPGVGAGPGGGPVPTERPDFSGLEAEPARFAIDTDWMAPLVLQAKSTFVWLDQLSRRFGREIRTLDAVPDEELDRLARWGVTGLWLIGVWQRSRASAEIKRRRGDPGAGASAYSIDEYRVADELGGAAALEGLAGRAAARGIRLAADMVPNHMGVDSRWVLEHPERFLAVAEAPYPAYAFEGPDLSADPGVELVLEDHYWDATDAAVVFRRRDRLTGETRFIYHGNDGTSFPWNDTAQLDYLRADVREAVIGTILEVARRFPVIRFDAAMVLARRHVRRLWWPAPGSGGGIPSRAEHALADAAFDAAMPAEFWREVVDRVAVEAPGTLLLAEAFWLMEGYFVRTLGMHRVYNSAFMHMLRDEDGPGYRKVIRDTLAFDPGVLGRFVNFLTNPDEASALEQFGGSVKYFGAAMVLATMPGLPMLGHGQLEGLGERYGMEFRRALQDEVPDLALVAEHERLIVPLLRERRRFAGSADFRLYDLVADDGTIDEHAWAYSNGRGDDRSLIVYHGRLAATAGRIRESAEYAVSGPDGVRRLERSSLADALGLPTDPGSASLVVTFRDPRLDVEVSATVGEIRERGLAIRLDAYAAFAFTEIRIRS